MSTELKKTDPSHRVQWHRRITRHLIQQRSFFPLSVGGDCLLCRTFHRDLAFERTPDVLLSPSGRVMFAAESEGTVVINPRQLGRSKGSYALITVHPPKEGAPAEPRSARIR